MSQLRKKRLRDVANCYFEEKRREDENPKNKKGKARKKADGDELVMDE